jgi:hypothetical protein
MDRKRLPEHACQVIDPMSLNNTLVIDPMSLNNALLHFQRVFKHLLGMENIVTDGFKAPKSLAYLAGLAVESVRLLRQRRVESGPGDRLGWSVMQLVHIID